MDNKLSVKDLINVGVFTAIYFVLFFISGMTGFIPIFAVLFPVVLAILAGIPMVLFLTKANKFGMALILGLLMGLMTFAMGHGWYVVATGIVCGLLADIFLKAGGYKSWRHLLLAYSSLSLWVIGSMLPMWIMKDAYFAAVSSGQGNDYSDSVSSLITGWMLPSIIVLTLLGAAVGAYMGRSVMKKHFKRAGIV